MKTFIGGFFTEYLNGIYKPSMNFFYTFVVFIISMNCKACNNPIPTPTYKINSNKVLIYCSQKCYHSTRCGSNSHYWKGGQIVKKTCMGCGNEFEMLPKQANGGRVYCSKKCASKSIAAKKKEKRIHTVCMVCKKDIFSQPNQIKKGGGKYCSKECFAKGFTLFKTGTNAPNYKNGNFIGMGLHKHRYLVKKNARAKGSHTEKEWMDLKNSYGNVCAKCKEEKPLTKDHIIPISKGGSNKIDNIQPLCLECNVKKFTKTIKYEHQLNLLI